MYDCVKISGKTGRRNSVWKQMFCQIYKFVCGNFKNYHNFIIIIIIFYIIYFPIYLYIHDQNHSWNPFNTQFIRWKYISRNLKWSTEGWWTSLLVFPQCLNEANIAWDVDDWRMLTQNMDFCDFWIFGLGMTNWRWVFHLTFV